MRHRQHVIRLIAIAGTAWLGLGTPAAGAQARPTPQRVQIPADVTTLEGVPTVRIDSAEGSVTRRVLTPAEAGKSRLTVRVVDGQFYWASRENRLLHLSQSGGFTYLASDPGTYVKFTRLNDRIAYVEHLDLAFTSVTWWGELRIAVGKQE
jgi:hypothetical protein